VAFKTAETWPGTGHSIHRMEYGFGFGLYFTAGLGILDYTIWVSWIRNRNMDFLK
jgi:hypothetical protein